MIADTNSTPKRPFGLTLALLGVLLFHALLPLAAVALLIYLENVMISGAEGGFIGIDIRITLVPLLFPVAIAVVLVVVAVLTWRGVRWMRLIFPASVAAYTLLLLAGYLLPALQQAPDITRGIDSTTTYQADVTTAYMLCIALLAAYVVWFSQRWSSRAFFRGYYTQADVERLQAYHADTQRAVPAR
jgi:hypothetical protein